MIKIYQDVNSKNPEGLWMCFLCNIQMSEPGWNGSSWIIETIFHDLQGGVGRAQLIADALAVFLVISCGDVAMSLAPPIKLMVGLYHIKMVMNGGWFMALLYQHYQH